MIVKLKKPREREDAHPLTLTGGSPGRAPCQPHPETCWCPHACMSLGTGVPGSLGLVDSAHRPPRFEVTNLSADRA